MAQENAPGRLLKQEVKIVKWLQNKSDIRVEGMYNGNGYYFEPGEYQPVEDDAATHLVYTRSSLVEVPAPSLKVEPEKSKYACPFCGKDYADAENPAKSLKGHILRCKAVIDKAEDEALVKAVEQASE